MSHPLALPHAMIRHPLLRPVRLARLRWISRHGGHIDWADIMGSDHGRWDAALARANNGPRVLVATGTGGHFPVTAIDRLLAVALTLRGAGVSVALCDGILDACQRCEVGWFPDMARFAREGPARDLCGACHSPADHLFRSRGFAVEAYGDHFTEADERRVAAVMADVHGIADALAVTWNGIDIGEHALAGALRFLARADLDGQDFGLAILKRYVTAALRTAMIAARMIAACTPEVVVLHHGVYVPQGVFAAVARQRGVRVVTWTPAYRRHSFLFTHDDTYHHAMMDEPVENWADRGLTTDQAHAIDRYLKSRWTGEADWISFQQPPDLSLTHDLATLGLAPDKPLILALTSVMWDAQLHYPANAFASQRDWLIDTVRWFAGRPDLQLAIRVHPAEVTGQVPSRQKVTDILAQAFPDLPPNIHVIPPESPVSTYDLARQADTALIYATKAGVELATMGIPVIVAGEAWVRNKGITTDVSSRDDYRACLDTLPRGARLSANQVERARRYAFHFFFRRMILLPMVERVPGPRMFNVTSRDLDALMPGACVGLDTICAGILTGAPFHMPENAI